MERAERLFRCQTAARCNELRSAVDNAGSDVCQLDVTLERLEAIE